MVTNIQALILVYTLLKPPAELAANSVSSGGHLPLAHKLSPLLSTHVTHEALRPLELYILTQKTKKT